MVEFLECTKSQMVCIQLSAENHRIHHHILRACIEQYRSGPDSTSKTEIDHSLFEESMAVYVMLEHEDSHIAASECV